MEVVPREIENNNCVLCLSRKGFIGETKQTVTAPWKRSERSRETKWFTSPLWYLVLAVLLLVFALRIRSVSLA